MREWGQGDNGGKVTEQYYLPGKWILQALEMCLYSMTRLFCSTNIVTLRGFMVFNSYIFLQIAGIQLTTLEMTRGFV